MLSPVEIRHSQALVNMAQEQTHTLRLKDSQTAQALDLDNRIGNIATAAWLGDVDPLEAWRLMKDVSVG